MLRAFTVGVALVVTGAWPTGAAFAAVPPDPSKIAASCFAADNPGGPFSATAPVTLWAGSPLHLRIGYRNGDQAADPAYYASFTTSISATAAFGAARVLDTDRYLGGGGFATGNVKGLQVATPAGAAPGTEHVRIEIVSDSAPGVLAACDFDLTIRALNADLDADGIANDLEINGLRDSAGNLVLTAAGTPAADFPALGANPCRKDLFVELRYQTGAGGHDHRPRQAALDTVVDAFRTAPVPGVAGGCPFAGYASAGGIHLGIDLGDPLPAETTTTRPDGSTAIDPIGCGNYPYASLDAARRPYFLQSAWAHQSAANSSQSGLSPCTGAGTRGFIVSLGLWTGGNGTAEDQSGTFMHELGHLLGLGHGGDSGINLKPNYLSVMNYSFQGGIPTPGGPDAFDYSRAALPALDEAALDENAGIGGPANRMTLWWGPQPSFRFPAASSRAERADGRLDFNQNGAFDSAAVSVDVNSDGVCVGPGPDNLRDTPPASDDVIASNMVWNGANRACDSRPSGDDQQAVDGNVFGCVTPGADGTLQTTPSGDDPARGNVITLGPNLVCNTTANAADVQFAPPGRTEPRLTGFDDWHAVDWRVGPTRTAPMEGIPLPPVESHHDLTEPELRAIERASQPSTEFDLETTTSVSAPDALPGDTLTFTSVVRNVGTATATNARLVETLPDGAQVTRVLPDLDPGRSATEMSAYRVPFPIADGRVLTGRAETSGQGPTGTTETVTNNNTATASATAHSARCKVTAAGQIGAARSFTVDATPLGPLTIGSTVYVDLSPRPIVALASVRTTGVACHRDHARIFGSGRVNAVTPVTFQVDVEDRGAGVGTDTFAIAWQNYSASGTLTRGNVRIIP